VVAWVASVGVVAVAALGLGAVPALAQDCPNVAIRAAQGPAVEALPDCMGLEMVSPPQKFLQGATNPSVSVDGSRVLLKSRGALNDPPGVNGTFTGDTYVATRGVSGWSVESTLPPTQPSGALIYTYNETADPGRSLSPDFSRWLTFIASDDQFTEGIAQTFWAGLGGVFEPLSPLLVPVDGYHGITNISLASFEGASADHSRMFFKPGDLGTAYLAGDPSPSGVAADRNGYVSGLDGDGGPGLELLARDWSGTVWGGRCGARLGGVVTTDGNGNGRDQGAVSADGSRVLFTTRPGQTGSDACDGVANRLRVMRRIERPYGPEVSQLVSSECDRVAPACDSTDGDDLFQGASVDQTKVFFLTSRQLTDSDLDGGGFLSGCQGFLVGGCDLYMYDSTRPVGERLTQVSAGDETNPTPGAGAGVRDGIAAISGDGSHVYFVADGVLTTDPSPSGTTATAGQPNLYLYQRDDEHPDGRIAFIGTAGASDVLRLWNAYGTFKGYGAYPVPVTGTDDDGVEVGGDGRVLVFISAAAMTTDDSDGGRRDVFRYDADGHELVRVSKGAPGGADNGPADVRLVENAPELIGTAFGEYKRWVSEDGQTITLQTPEGLASDDTNGLSDDYLWRGGQMYRLPGTSRPAFSFSGVGRLPTPALSHDGTVVAFESYEQLLGADGDTVSDIYTARVDGGFPEPDPGEGCVVLADGCQGGGADSLTSRSDTASGGAGNTVRGKRVQIRGPVLRAAARRNAASSGVLVLRVRTSSGGRLSVVARARVNRRVRRVGSASRRASGAGVVQLRLRLARPVRARLRSGRPVRVTLVARHPGARSRTVTVRLPGGRS
jgi:hypothetical protein